MEKLVSGRPARLCWMLFVDGPSEYNFLHQKRYAPHFCGYIPVLSIKAALCSPFFHEKRYVPILRAEYFFVANGSTLGGPNLGRHVRHAVHSATAVCVFHLFDLVQDQIGLGKIGQSGFTCRTYHVASAGVSGRHLQQRNRLSAGSPGRMELTDGSVSGIPGLGGEAGPIPASRRDALRGQKSLRSRNHSSATKTLR